MFTGTDGWELNSDTMMVLDKLKEWQEVRGLVDGRVGCCRLVGLVV